MLAAGSGCRHERTDGPAPATRAASQQAAATAAVEWAGCAVVRRGPRCALGGDRRLTLWLAGDAAGIQLSSDRGPIASGRGLPVQGGTRFSLDVPIGARWLRASQPGGAPIATLAIEDATPHPEIDELLATGKQGRHRQSAARLAEIAATGPVELRGAAAAAYGRLQLALGDVVRAKPALRASIEAARREGRLSDEVRDASALLWAEVELEQRFSDARAVLDAARPAGESYPEGRAWLAFNAGLLAFATGDQRAALASYRAAERSADRLGRAALADDAAAEVARILRSLGRADEAVAILERERPEEDPCAAATSKINRAWAMTERQAEPGRVWDPRVWSALEEARAATRACPDPHRRLVATINAAEYALDAGDEPHAADLSAALGAERSVPDALTASWRADVLGRWSLRKGRAREARSLFAEQIAIARGASLWEEAFRGEVGMGRALVAGGRGAQALAHLQAAQALLERMLEGVPLAEGRGGFLSGHDEGVRALVDALVERGAPARAARIARLARAVELTYAARADRLGRLTAGQRAAWDDAIGGYMRIRRALEHEAEQDWTLSRAALERARAQRELRAEQARDSLDRAYRLLVAPGEQERAGVVAPGPGELHLVVFPAVQGWIAFAVAATGVVAERFADGAVASEEAAAVVLARFSAQLAAARRVRILAYGRADRVDWHAVTWQGAPLIASAEVEYGLDVPARDAAGGGVDSATTVLLVSNPAGDLPAASAETRTVASTLRGWRVTRLDGAIATRDALLASMPGAGLFHYAGHAEVGGADGMASALLLARGARVELGDLLASPRVPAVVVLSACDAGAPGAGSSMGLAQVFVASGTRAALAPVRPVRDQEARVFIEGFYAGLAGLTSPRDHSLAAAFRRAALGSSGEHGAGWRSFRLMTP